MALRNAILPKIKYSLKTVLWMLNGYFGKVVSLETPHKITVLITYFNPIRMKKINFQIRNILKCSFLDKVIVSNHNSDILIEDKLKIRDSRLVLLNQKVKRACGYRWQIARKINAEYLVVIDNDILLFPQQLRILSEKLILEPQMPHGISGMVRLENGDFEYHDKEDIEVDYLCEVHAVTKAHVEKYFQLESLLAKEDKALPDTIERLGDFVVISRTGTQKSKIHEVGRLFRKETFKMPGIQITKMRILNLF